MSRKNPVVSKLLKSIEAIFVHGITGRDIEEQTLAAGALVRNVVTEETEDGDLTRFQVLGYNGRDWYNYRSFESFKGLLEVYAPNGLKVRHVKDGDTTVSVVVAE